MTLERPPGFGPHRLGNHSLVDLFAPSGFMKVYADYAAKPYDEWRAADWPETYQVPGHDNIFAVGIAFAPPHPISKPRKSANGTVIAPSPPRTGMPSGGEESELPVVRHAG